MPRPATGGTNAGRPRGRRRRPPFGSGWAPPGTYDPALRYQARSAALGLEDLLEDTTREGDREAQDYRTGLNLGMRDFNLGLRDLQREFGRGKEDIGTSRERLDTTFAQDLQDLAVARQRGEEDYERTLTGLQRRYAAQRFQQAQAIEASGTAEGGTRAASDQVRGANRRFEKGEIDLERQRQIEDFERQEELLERGYGEQTSDLDRALARLGEDVGTQRQGLFRGLRTDAQLARRDLGRGRFDRGEQRSRAKREAGRYRQTLRQQSHHQAREQNPGVLFPNRRNQRRRRR